MCECTYKIIQKVHFSIDIYIYGTIFNGKRFISASKGINKKGEREKMNKFKKILLGTLSVLTLGLFVSVGTDVEAATVTKSYEITAYDGSDIISDSSRSMTTSVGDGTSNNVVFTVGSSITYDNSKGLAIGLASNGATNGDTKKFVVSIPSGYYVSSFTVKADNKTSARDINLASTASTTPMANTHASKTVKSSTATVSFIDDDARLDYTSAGGDIYINCGGSMTYYEVKLTLDVDSETNVETDEDSVNYTFDNYNIDLTKLTGTKKDGSVDYEDASSSDLRNFYVPYGTNTSGRVFKYVNSGTTVTALQHLVEIMA